MLAFPRPPPLSTGAHPLTTLFVGRGTIDIADPLLGPPPCNRPPADAATKDSRCCITPAKVCYNPEHEGECAGAIGPPIPSRFGTPGALSGLEPFPRGARGSTFARRMLR